MSASDSGASQSHPGEDGGAYEQWVGRVLDDRYRIDGLLGEGGMGAVFEAEHLKLAKKVALKVIHPEFAGDGEVAKRFAREAMASAQMEHPHVASATDYGTLPEGGAYLVMQFVRGSSLRAVLDAEGAIGWVRACEVGAQVADALSAAHKAGIVHRDLKPDNVMLEPRDDGSHLVKVLDFGIARVADEKLAASGQALTRIGTIIGTPGYMAPEQALGEPVDFRVDLYALGLLLHEMSTGARVFEIDDLTAIVTRQLTEDAQRLSHLVANVPDELDELVSSLLRKDREARPGSAAEVRETLRNLLIGATLQAVQSGEHVMPAIGTAALIGASQRDPTPLGVRLQRTDPKAPPVGTAPTMARPAPPRTSTTDDLRRVAAAATARTSVTMRKVQAEVVRSRLPVPLLGMGCAAMGLVAMTILGGVMLFSGGGNHSNLRKVEHDRPIVLTPASGATASSANGERAATPIPEALSQAFADLLVSENRRTRRRAAATVLAYQPQEDVPEVLAALVGLERASRCTAKREQVLRIETLGDARALPALQRLDAMPRDGCRRAFRRFDCVGCMREDLERAMTTLGGAD